ncbi:unnamed protein product [Spirodela intermedia]|uniref:Uncharacterized protein n=1 Tax=Spirodela intermedia TaxID=51605 RepID=A0A7I8K2J6_SPIIN|nr:unnamed protein product [Spirodela intermedia]
MLLLPPYKGPPNAFSPAGITALSWASTSQNARVPQSHRYSRVPQVLEWHLSHFHFFSPCLRQYAREGSWWTQVGSGHTYTRRFTSVVLFCRSFHGRLCPLRCNCRFCSLWNPFLHTSQMKRFVASRVFGDRAITSAYLLGVPGRFLFFF